MSSKYDIIYPCPVSRAYGIPRLQAWRLLAIFILYRLLLTCTLIAFQYLPLQQLPFIVIDNRLFSLTCAIYLVATCLSALALSIRRWPYSPQAQILIFTDVLAIILLIHACGGIVNGIGTLLVISIAFGGILIGGHCAILFAALATLMLFAEQRFGFSGEHFSFNRYAEAGMLGASLLATALLANELAKRSEQSQRIAQQQKQTILRLEELNRTIIQYLQAGIIIVDKQQHIFMANQTALHLLRLTAAPKALASISVALANAFNDWLSKEDNHEIHLKEIQPIHCRFSRLPTQTDLLFMLTLEDATLYNQRLQQGKLASLGRLTASIAHEIRNPLGAISHATQLLVESPELTPQDQRLTHIIQSHALRINDIIEDILQLSRRKASQPQNLDINLWLETYAAQFIDFQDLKPEQIRLELSSDTLQAAIDPSHLQQILDNLCTNALKHNNQALPIISLSSEQTSHGICINIADNGTSMSSETIEHLFEPFFTTSSKGTGLGLYISKELAELNHAELTYQSQQSQQNQVQINSFRLCLTNAEPLPTAQLT